MRQANNSFIKSFVIILFVLLLVQQNLFAERRIRIHFVAASFSFAKDEAENSKLAAYASKAGYDAVWEASVPSGFPYAFGAAKRVVGSGLSQARTKDNTQNCDAELSFSGESSYPGISVYNISGDEYALEIVAPHASLLKSPPGTLCSLPIFVVYAPGAGVVSTPEYVNIPNEPGRSSPPPISQFAAFKVDAKKPETTINFSYVQEANFPQLKYTSKSVWFGYVTVELNPIKSIPGAIDPLKLYNYSPPDSFLPPADPPAPPTSGCGGGGSTITPRDITTFLRNPIIKEVVDSLQALQQIWNLISTQQLVHKSEDYIPSAYTYSNEKFTYDATTRKLTLISVPGAPGSGSTAFKIAVGDGAAKSAGKSISIQASGSQNVELILPTALIKAFNKGKKFPVEVIASFTSSANKKVKGSVTKKVTIKKRV